jgi:hypothetical protein
MNAVIATSAITSVVVTQCSVIEVEESNLYFPSDLCIA